MYHNLKSLNVHLNMFFDTNELAYLLEKGFFSCQHISKKVGLHINYLSKQFQFKNILIIAAAHDTH